MSPTAALHSRIFLAYLFIIPGVLVVAGLVLCLFTFVLKKSIRSVWLTYRSWLVMAPAFLLVVFLGRPAVIAAVCVLAVFGFKEFARATGLYADWWMTAAVYVAIIATATTAFVPHKLDSQPSRYSSFSAVPIYAILAFILIPIVRNRTQGQLQTVALCILGYFLLGWMFGHFGYLANAPNPQCYGYVLYIGLATELNDVAAFTCGKLLGRHKLRGNISPGKTWEGAVGALAVAMVLPWLLRFSLPQFGPAQLVLTGIIVGVGGQLGDLSISLIKRDIGIKDMGATIPGHGGILDRIDSLIFVAPLFARIVHWFYGLQ